MPTPTFKSGLTGDALEKAFETCDEIPPFLIDQFLTENMTLMLSGDGDSGKSIITLCAAASATTGSPLFGQFSCCRPLKIYWLVGERSAREPLTRLKQMRYKLPFDRDNLVINGNLVGTINLSDPNYTHGLIGHLAKEMPGLDVLLLEPVYTMVPAWDERHVLGLVQSLSVIKANLNCAIWLTHHNTKPQLNHWGKTSQPKNAYYGPVWLFNHCEAQYSVEKTGEYTRTLNCQKDTNRILLKEIPLIYEPIHGVVEMDPNCLNAPLKVIDRVRLFLLRCEKEKRGFRLPEIMLQTGVSRPWFFKVIETPPWSGRIENVNPPGNEAYYMVKNRQ